MNLRRLRLDLKLNQETLAHNANISSRFLKYLEVGKKQPSMETIFKLCRAMNVTPNELLLSTFEKWRDQQD